MTKAVVCDYDGTLTPNIMPKFDILEKSGLKGGVANPEFFKKVHEMAERERIDAYEAMIRLILKIVSDAGLELTNENIGLGAKNRTYNRGVPEFLRELKESGIKTYILSSGAKAYLDQTEIAPYLTNVFASTLTYDETGRVNGIGLVMSAKQKAETLRKLALELNGNEDDCQGIIYFGDGPTDVDAMTFIKERGGKVVMVYNTQPAEEAKELVENGLVDLFAEADYSRNSKIYKFVLNTLN